MCDSHLSYMKGGIYKYFCVLLFSLYTMSYKSLQINNTEFIILVYNTEHSIVWMCYNLFNRPPKCGHLGCFQNYSVTTLHIQSSMYNFHVVGGIPLGQIPRSGILGQNTRSCIYISIDIDKFPSKTFRLMIISTSNI